MDDLAGRHWNGTPPVHSRYIWASTGVPWYGAKYSLAWKQNCATAISVFTHCPARESPNDTGWSTPTAPQYPNVRQDLLPPAASSTHTYTAQHSLTHSPRYRKNNPHTLTRRGSHKDQQKPSQMSPSRCRFGSLFEPRVSSLNFF